MQTVSKNATKLRKSWPAKHQELSSLEKAIQKNFGRNFIFTLVSDSILLLALPNPKFKKEWNIWEIDSNKNTNKPYLGDKEDLTSAKNLRGAEMLALLLQAEMDIPDMQACDLFECFQTYSQKNEGLFPKHHIIPVVAKHIEKLEAGLSFQRKKVKLQGLEEYRAQVRGEEKGNDGTQRLWPDEECDITFEYLQLMPREQNFYEDQGKHRAVTLSL